MCSGRFGVWGWVKNLFIFSNKSAECKGWLGGWWNGSYGSECNIVYRLYRKCHIVYIIIYCVLNICRWGFIIGRPNHMYSFECIRYLRLCYCMCSLLRCLLLMSCWVILHGHVGGLGTSYYDKLLQSPFAHASHDRYFAWVSKVLWKFQPS